MRKILNVSTAMLLGVAFFGAVLVSGTREAEARPNYYKAFYKQYSGLKDAVKEQKCNVCHVKKEKKKVRNNYGDALAKVLGEEKVKDADKIKKALKETEKKDSAVEGKTFGDLIEAGKLPASKE